MCYKINCTVGSDGYMDTSKLIKAIRAQLGMSQDAFAKAIHVAFSTVNRWENNRTTPNTMTWVFIADYCEKHNIDEGIIAATKEKGNH